MSYFVTGATGFIGRHLVELLLKREGTIHALVREGSRGRLDELADRLGAKDRIVAVVGDMTKPGLGIEGFGERVDHFETVRVRKDGAHVDISLSVSPIRDRQGRIVGAAKVARDISDAKRLRRAERELLDHLQELTTELEQQIDEGQSLQEELERLLPWNWQAERAGADPKAAA